MQKRIYLSPPHMSGEEMSFVKEAFGGNWVAPAGPNIQAFEDELGSYCDVPNYLATISGTAALHLALVVAGVQRDDEVICSTFTFIASCTPIRYQGAVPVFVDAEPGTWNMDPGVLEEAIKDRINKGKKPKAIVLVHVYGMPARLDEILSIAKTYDILLIEDAAEAFGSTYRGKKVGAFGDMGIYSFNGNKIITTSGGGALVSIHKKWVDEARYLANQATERNPNYVHQQIGYTYRLSNVCAGIGRGQLSVIDQRVQQRRAVFDFYREALAHLGGISFQQEPEGGLSNRWLTCIQIDPAKSNAITPEVIRQSLEERNIESRPLWTPMHLQPVFKGCPYYGGDVSEKLFKEGLCLPSGSAMTVKELSEVVRIVDGTLEEDSME